jgi:hypothetical protein
VVLAVRENACGSKALRGLSFLCLNTV